MAASKVGWGRAGRQARVQSMRQSKVHPGEIERAGNGDAGTRPLTLIDRIPQSPRIVMRAPVLNSTSSPSVLSSEGGSGLSSPWDGIYRALHCCLSDLIATRLCPFRCFTPPNLKILELVTDLMVFEPNA